MKRVLYFTTKLNSRDIKKCNCFWVPSYDLFASAHKSSIPAPTVTSVDRLRNTWLSTLFQLVDNYSDNSTKSSFKFTPIDVRKNPPLISHDFGHFCFGQRTRRSQPASIVIDANLFLNLFNHFFHSSSRPSYHNDNYFQFSTKPNIATI